MPRSAPPPVGVAPGAHAHLKNSQGRLTDVGLHAFAQLVRAGAGPAELAAAFAMSYSGARDRLAQVRAALSLPTIRERQAARRDEIVRRADAGEPQAAIAAAVGLSLDRIRRVLCAANRGRWRVLRLSVQDEAEIERRLVGGASTRQVAAAFGVDQGTIWRRQKALRGRISADLPPCRCGKPANHGGRCAAIVDPEHLHARLLAGATAADLAREAGISAQGFKPKYVQPVIDRLTAEGHLCGCGEPFGHPRTCTFTARRLWVNPSFEQHARADELVGSIRRLTRDRGRARPFRFRFSPAVTMATAARHKASRLARQGWGVAEIMKRTGETDWRVTMVVGELKAAGMLPPQCAGCDQPYGHRGPCPKPKTCRCGRPRNHRGPCRRADGRRPSPQHKLTTETIAIINAKFRGRASIRSISRSTGVSFSVVQRLVKRWREASRYGYRDCACGRPAFHPGGCEVNTPGALGWRWTARIEKMVEAGEPVHRIASALNISLASAQKHSRRRREELFRQGVTCACGRLLGHAFWCSAKWDAWEMPRGHRPLPAERRGQILARLHNGDAAKDIASAAGLGQETVFRVRRDMAQEELEQRRRAIAKRIARKAAEPLSGEELMARIQAAVPRSLDAAVRDDVIGELHLAVLEGRIEAEQVGAAVRSFVSRGLSEWQSQYGPRSLDERLFEDGTLTLGDLIPDTTTIEQLEEVLIGLD